MATDKSGLRDLLFRSTHLLVMSLLVLVLAGVSALGNLPRIEDPRIATRNALILTELPGASAARIEALVTKPLEDKLREVDEIKHIVSTSRANISVLSLELVDRVDKSDNQQIFSLIRDELAEVEPLLPPGAGKPELDTDRATSAFALVVSLSVDDGNKTSMGVLTRLADELGDRFRNLGGTERVNIYGDAEEEIAVTLARGDLAAYGLSSAQLASLIASADPKSPAGALRTGDRAVFLEVGGELDSTDRIRNLVLRRGDEGRQLRLGDLAEVSREFRDPPNSYGYVNGRRSVFVGVVATDSVRIDRWQASADAVLESFAASIDDGIRIDEVFRQSEYTTERLSSLSGNLLLGAMVVMLVVLFGLGWRAAVIVGLALPLSASVTLFGLTFFDQQIHQMTIFGMIIAIGLLIDNAIVVTDEVQKRLKQGVDRRSAVAGTVSHLFAPLFASTLTTILGFMPIFLLPGNIGDFVRPIAISVVLALAASFVISLTIIAALAGRLLPASTSATSTNDPWWRNGVRAQALTAVSEKFLLQAFARPGLTAGAALLLPIAGFLLAGTLSLQFFPPADRNQFEVQVWMPEQSSLANSRNTALAIDALIRQKPGVQQVSWLVGGSHPQIYYNRIMKEDNNAAYAHAMVQTDSVATTNQLVLALQTELELRFPQAQIVAAVFAQGPPVDAPVGIRVSGPSVEKLSELGKEIRRVMTTVPGISDSRASIRSRAKLSFDTEQSEANRTGLSLTAIAAQMQGDLEGFVGGSLREDLENLPVRIRYQNDVRSSLNDISSLPILASDGTGWVPADALGAMQLTPENASITRRNGVRMNVINAWVEPGTLPIEAANRVLQRLDQEGFTLPPGYTLQLEGDSDAQQSAVGQLGTYLPILLMLMVTTLILSFRSASAAALIGSVAGLSAGLGMLSLWLSGYNLGFNPLIGLAGLVGVAINGAIVVLAALRADTDARSGNTAAVVAVTLRESRHVLATTATTIGGFLPLLIFSSGEFWPPLAVVIGGGVGFAVILSLLFTPAVFLLITNPPRLRMSWRAAVPASVLVILGGCATGPEVAEVPTFVDAPWLDAPGNPASQVPTDWWTTFDDPLIDGYVTTALQQNTDIGLAVARLEEAGALRRQSRSRLLPQLNLSGSAADFQLSAESPNIAAAGGMSPIEGELFDTSFNASWVIDVFGSERNRLRASRAIESQNAALVEGTRLRVAAETVRGIIELRSLQQRLQIALENETLQEQTLTLVEARQKSGLAPELDALNARAQLAGTRAVIPELRAGVRNAMLRLATLTNQSPRAVIEDHSVPRPIPHSRLKVDPGLRGDVLRRRPDVRAAEQTLAAALAEARVATAAFFPQFSLSAAFGWQAQTASQLGRAPTEAWTLATVLAQPLFAGGALRAQSAAARARLSAADHNYRATLLRAIEDSEGSMHRYQRSVESTAHSRLASTASAEAADIAARLYASGLQDFLAVLDAERRKLEAENRSAELAAIESLRLVSVYEALGAI